MVFPPPMYCCHASLLAAEGFAGGFVLPVLSLVLVAGCIAAVLAKLCWESGRSSTLQGTVAV